MVIVRPENERIFGWLTKRTLIAIGFVVASTVIGFFCYRFLYNFPDLSSDPTIRSIQFWFYEKVRGWNETEVVKQIIAKRLAETKFFPDGIMPENEGTFFQYFDKDNQPIGMYSIVGLITGWVSGKYYLEVTDRAGEKYYFNLVPIPGKPIYESHKIHQQQTRQKNLTYSFCAWRDITEVIWSDTKETSFIRPDELKFVYRPDRCWR